MWIAAGRGAVERQVVTGVVWWPSDSACDVKRREESVWGGVWGGCLILRWRPDKSVWRHEEINKSLCWQNTITAKKQGDGVDRYVARMVSINTYTVLIKKPKQKKVEGWPVAGQVGERGRWDVLPKKIKMYCRERYMRIWNVSSGVGSGPITCFYTDGNGNSGFYKTLGISWTTERVVAP